MTDVPSRSGAGFDQPPRPATDTYPEPAPYVDPAPYPETTTYESTTATTSGATESSPSGTDRAKEVASQGTDAAKQAAGDVKDTAKEQAQRVASEAKTQAKDLAGDLRNRVGDQARTQNDKLVTGIRAAADNLDEMRRDRDDSPAVAAVSRVADGGRQLADYLDQHGPEGVLRDVQDFARRRPGAFLVTAFAAGFLATRVGKGIAKAGSSDDQSKPASDTYAQTGYPATASGPDYPATTTTGTDYTTTTGTDYASTGTGMPRVVADGDVR